MEPINALNNLTGLEIAVIGMAGKFPGAQNTREFRDNLEKGIETIAFFSDQELEQAGIDRSMIKNPNYVKAMGVLEDNDLFDAGFFDYTPVEAQLMDPQMRLFHQCAWEALEDAGYDSYNYPGPIGLFAGAGDNLYWRSLSILSGAVDQLGEFESRKLTNKDFICARTAYKLNLKGPVFSIQTACSTSLVAIHQGCQGLLSGECEIALAGGVSVNTFKSGYIYQEGMIFSPDGHCRAFDNNAKGTLAGSGVGIVVLKRLPEALAEGDCIHAVIKGSAINNDGVQKVGFTAPSVEGQRKVITEALRVAQVEVESIGYIETHGTGTILGDPIEIEALKLAYKTDKKGFCAIGSVKSNIGHLDTAAGVASFIKTVMALKHRLIPPTLYFETPNRKIDFINSPFYINTTLTRWENAKYPLRAGISSLGIGGTNAHIVLEDAPGGTRGLAPLPDDKVPCQGRGEVSSPITSREYQLILLSAKTQTALDKITGNLANYFKEHPDVNLADVAYTLQVGRKALKYRRMEVCSTVYEAINLLSMPSNPDSREVHEFTPKEQELDIDLIMNQLKENSKNISEFRDLLNKIGGLWLCGKKIDWNEFYFERKRKRISLPTYPFERRRYWIESNLFALAAGKIGPKLPIYKKSDIVEWFYLPSWKRTQLLTEDFARSPEYSCWLVFVEDSGFGDKIVDKLKEMKQDVISVKVGNTFTKVYHQGYTYTVNPRQENDYVKLLEEMANMGKIPGKILHLWSLSPGVGEEIDAERFDNIQYRGFYSLLFLAKAINKLKWGTEIQIGVLTSRTQDVSGEEDLLSPAVATILAASKVIPQEYPYISCHTVDIILPPPGGWQEKQIINQVLHEFSSDSAEPVIAYRGYQRWIQSFEPLRLGESKKTVSGLRNRGVYLIIGGLGKIGFVLAQYLVQQVQAKLILVMRSFIPTGKEGEQWLKTHKTDDSLSCKILKIRELEQQGGEVIAVKADVGNLEQMKQVIAAAEVRFGPINGVFHAAGNTTDSIVCPIERLDRNHSQDQFQARVYGCLVLEKILENKNLDFCILISSLVSVLGGLGFAAYAASVIFMDTFVHYHNRKHPLRWMSINMAEWQFKEIDRRNSFISGETIALYMNPQEGLETIHRILSQCRENQVVVSTGDLQNRIDKWIKLESLRQEAPTSKEASPALYPRPQLSKPYVPPENSRQQTLVEIWQNFFGIQPIGIEDDFFELGGDSLKVITMISRLHKEFNIKISLEEFFKDARIRKLSRYLEKDNRKDKHISVEPAEKKEYYRVSAAQQRLYLLQQFDLTSTNYNMPYVLQLGEEIDVERLESIFEKIITRHEGFRTSFTVIEDELVQRIHDGTNFQIKYFVGVTAGKDGARHSSLEEESIIENFVKPFDLSAAPLLRVGLIKTGNKRHVLLFDMHHIIADGISQDILKKEFMTLYNHQQLLPLKLQYKDFSRMQNSKVYRQSVKSQEEYWINRFSHDIRVLNLPTDFPRPPVQNFEGDNYHFELNETITKKLKKMINEKNVTLFIILIAIYNILLARLSGEEDIIVGIPVAGRNHEDLKDIIGMFVNTVALRSFPGKTKIFTEFLEETKIDSLKAFENQDYQFELLLNKVQLHRDLSRTPLFDTVFNVLNFFNTPGNPGTNPVETGTEISPYGFEAKTAKFDIAIYVYDMNHTIKFTCNYRTSIFKESTIKYIMSQYIALIEEILANPCKLLKDYEIFKRKTGNTRKKFNFIPSQNYPGDMA